MDIYNTVDDSRAFVCVDTSRIHSAKELALALDSMDDNVFYFHVTPERNDFAAWSSDVLGIPELAEKIGGIKGKDELSREVMKFVILNM